MYFCGVLGNFTLYKNHLANNHMNMPFTFANLLRIINKSAYLILMLLVGSALVLIEDPQLAAVTTMAIGCIGLSLLFGKLTAMVKGKNSLHRLTNSKAMIRFRILK